MLKSEGGIQIVLQEVFFSLSLFSHNSSVGAGCGYPNMRYVSRAGVMSCDVSLPVV